MHQVVAAAGHAVTERQQAGRGRLVKVQLAIGVVLHDQGLGAGGELQHAHAALQAECGATGVAKGGNQVHQLGLVLGNQLLQTVHVHPVGVNRSAN